MHHPHEVRVKNWSETFLDAAGHGELEKAQELLGYYNGEREGDVFQSSLRRALQTAAQHGYVSLARFLLEEGASIQPAEKETAALVRAVEAQSRAIVELLLSDPIPALRRAVPLSSIPETDTEEIGRNCLFTAVAEGNYDITCELLRAGVHANCKDTKSRTALIYLCAQGRETFNKLRAPTGEQPRYEEVVNVLLSNGLDIEAKGEDARTALHWAVARGHEELVSILLGRCQPVRARVDTLSRGKKTALHIAATKKSAQIVDLLLECGADPGALSEGNWTPLHVAAKHGHIETLRMLLGLVDAEAATDNGKTALHWAAENGHIACVEALLPFCRLKRHAKDSKGKSPWMLAAKMHHSEIMHLLSPFNDDEHLSPLQKRVCQDFVALVTDVHPQKKGREKYISSEKVAVYDLLYATKNDEKHKKQSPMVSVRPKQDSVRKGVFRWIHLPANNMAWVEVMLTKYYMERGASEVEAFQRTANFLNLQHRGNTVHSQYMRPSCQRIRPNSGKDKTGSDFLGDQQVDRWSDSEDPKKLESEQIQKEVRRSIKPLIEWASLGKSLHEGQKSDSPRASEHVASPSNRSPGEPTLFPPKALKRTHTGLMSIRSTDGIPPSARGTRPASRMSQHSVEHFPKSVEANHPMDFGEIFLFMPYMHFELQQKSLHMSEVQEEVFKLGNPRKAAEKAKYRDEASDLEDVISHALPHDRPALEQMFFSAHDAASIDSRTPLTPMTPATPLTPGKDLQAGEIDKQWSRDVMLTHAYLLEASPLHPRRTLDQFYYPTGNTTGRDSDQVVYRYYRNYGLSDPKVFMVDQLWLWILDKDLVVTSFPYHWEQEDRSDSFNLAQTILEDLKEFHLASVYDFASSVTNRCSGMFYSNANLEEYRFLEMFEQSIADLHDEEPELSLQFKKASQGAEKWFRDESKTVKNPTFDDYFTKVGKEMKLLTEAKDIESEIDMVFSVLKEQERLLPILKDNIKDEFQLLRARDQKAHLRTTFDTQVNEIHGIHERLERMKREVREFYNSCKQLLDLKQQYAGVFEARYSRIQATSTVRQGHTIMVFTIVTVIFLPISFIAAIFAIPAAEFPPDGSIRPHLFLILLVGLLVSIPLVILAFTVDSLIRWSHKKRKAISGRWRKHIKEIPEAEGGAGDEDEDQNEDEDDHPHHSHLQGARRRKSQIEFEHLPKLRGPTLTHVSQADKEFFGEHGQRYGHLIRHLFGHGHDEDRRVHHPPGHGFIRQASSKLFNKQEHKKGRKKMVGNDTNNPVYANRRIRYDLENGHRPSDGFFETFRGRNESYA